MHRLVCASITLTRLLASTLLSALLLSAGCDADLQLSAPSDDRVYSLYGVLNPARDTQWIRVEPLPVPTSAGAPPTIDATVSLRNLATGRHWTLHDSLMEVQTELQHNFWTTAPILPGTTYRLVARRSDGATSTVTTTTPSHPPALSKRPPNRFSAPISAQKRAGLTIFVHDVEHLAGAKAVYYDVYGFVHTFVQYEHASRTPEGYKIPVLLNRDLNRMGYDDFDSIDSLEVVVAAGGPDWPNWERYHGATIREITLADSFSNVEGGLGRVSGIYTDTTDL